MPPATSIRKFIEALQNRETHFTEVADAIFSNPGNVPNLPLGAAAWAQFQQRNSLNDDLRQTSPDIAAFLADQGMTPAELDHIDRWDNGLKERLRARLATAISGREPAMKFYWELHGRPREDADIEDHTIVFKSPQRGVRITSADVSGEVELG